MNLVLSVAKREMKALVRNKRTVFSVVTFIVAWGFISLPRLTGRLGSAGGTGNSVFLLSTLLCVYTGFILSAQAFLGEKKESRIGTLLCTPLTIRQFWLGKVIGVVIPSYALGIIVTLGVGAVFSVTGGGISVPPAPVFIYLFFLLPLLLACIVGLLGLLQLILGMRENRIVNIVIMILLFGGLGLSGSLGGGGGFVSWALIGVMLGVVLLFFALLSYITRFIRIERIITSLE